MELCFWFISSKGKKKKRIIYDCIAIPIKRLLHSQRKHEEVTRHEFLGVLSQINDWGSWWCVKQWNSDHCKQKKLMLLQRRAYQDLTEFFCKFPGSLHLQRPHLPLCTETLRSPTHFQALAGVLEMFHHPWELTAHFLGFNLSEDTFSGWRSIYGVFWRNSDQEWDLHTRSVNVKS